MKKILFWGFMIMHNFGFTMQDQMRRFDPIKPLLSAQHQLHSKMDAFCQSAIHAFGAEGLITVDQVLACMKVLDAHGYPGRISFSDSSKFLEWVLGQKKTILVLYDREAIKSSICLEYLNYISKQPGFTADWYAVDYDHLSPILLELQEAGNDTMQPTDVIPNVVFVIDGQLWQIPEDLAAVGLRYWIDLYAAA